MTCTSEQFEISVNKKIILILNHEVVIGENKEWLFDVDSNLARRYGHIL